MSEIEASCTSALQQACVVTGLRARFATAAAVPVMTQLINDAYQCESFFKIGSRTSEPAVLAAVEKPLPNGAILFLGADDSIKASVVVSVFPDEAYGFFSMLAVHPSQQGSGLGSRILVFLETYFRLLGLKQVRITCVNLRHELIGPQGFYRKRGYTETGRVVEWDAAQRPFFKLDCHLIEFGKAL